MSGDDPPGLVDGKVAVVTGVGPGLGGPPRSRWPGRARRSRSSPAAPTGSTTSPAEITAAGGRALAVPASVTKPEDCERVAATAVEEFGGIDIVVNSAFRGDPFTPVEALGPRRVAQDLRGQLLRPDADDAGVPARDAGAGRRQRGDGRVAERPQDPAERGRLRGEQGRADHRSPGRSPPSSRPTTSGSTRSCRAGSGVRTCSSTSTGRRSRVGSPPRRSSPRSPPRSRWARSRRRRTSRSRSCSSRPACRAMITGQTLDVNGGEFFG